MRCSVYQTLTLVLAIFVDSTTHSAQRCGGESRTQVKGEELVRLHEKIVTFSSAGHQTSDHTINKWDISALKRKTDTLMNGDIKKNTSAVPSSQKREHN